MREGVNQWEQVKRGLAEITDPFLPNPNQFAKDCKGKSDGVFARDMEAQRVAMPKRFQIEDISGKEKARESGKNHLQKMAAMFEG